MNAGTPTSRAPGVSVRGMIRSATASTTAPSSLLRNSGCQLAPGFGEQPLQDGEHGRRGDRAAHQHRHSLQELATIHDAVVAHTFIRFSSPTA